MNDIPLPQGWAEQPLSDLVAKLESGVSVNAVDRACGSDQIGVLKTSCVNGGQFDPRENKAILDRSEIRRAVLNPRRDSILISRMNTFDLVGECAYVDKDYSHLFIPDRLWQTVMRGDADTCVKWLSYVVRSPLFRHSVSNAATGTSGSMKNISQPSYLGIRVRVPPPLEQRKIARILTTLDNLIEKTEALIAKYQAIRHGMMHDLFTCGIDAQGHLRPTQAEAPDLYRQSELGWIPKEWASPTVGSVLVHRPKNGYSPKESDEWTGTVMLGLGCLTPSGFEPIQLKNAPRNDPNLAFALLRDGDLLISRSNTRDLVALVGIYRDIGTPCIYSDLMIRLVPTDEVLPEYLEAILRHAPVRRQLTNASCGTSGSMMKINAEMVLSTVISLPKHVEQRRILDRVASCSGLIAQARQEQDKLRRLKTGLMQELLTGRVRAKVNESEEVTAHG